MKSKLCLGVILLSIQYCMGQKTVSISYKNFLENITTNNPLAVRANNYAALGKAEYEAARGNYDPFISATTNSKYYNDKNYYNVTEAGLRQPIFTSQYIKAGYEYGNGNFINPEQLTSSYGMPYLGVEVSLLQGMMIDKRRSDVLKAKNYVQYYSAEQRIIMNNLLYESAQIYFEWLFVNKQYDLYTYFLKLANQRLKGIESLANVGERPSIDTVEAAILMQSRSLDQQSARIENIKMQNELLNLNWINSSTPADTNTSVVSLDNLDICFERAKQVLFKSLLDDSLNNPIVLQYEAKQKILEVEKRLKKELIKPKLDVSYNLLSNNSNSSVPVFSTNNYKWGASFSLPLFLRNPRNEYKVASLNAKNNSLNLASKTNELRFKHKYLKQSVSVLIEQLSNAERSVAYGKRLLEAEKLKFENGESSLFLLNTRENKLLESELKLSEYKLKFIKFMLSMTYLKGNLNYSF